MNAEKLITQLDQYKCELFEILLRYIRTHSSVSMRREDDPRYRQIVAEVLDLLRDSLGKNDSYSANIHAFFEEGLANFFGGPSYKSVENIITVLRAAITRVERRPDLVLLPDAKLVSQIDQVWTLLHPSVVALAKTRFAAGHYADAVESVLKEVNNVVKALHQAVANEELDGAPLMRKAFSPNRPTIKLDDLATESGRNIQQGHMDLFAGAMIGIRNPKAHGNIIITPERAIHHFFLASLLFYKVDEREA